MGVMVTVKVKAEDTGGAYSVFEDLIPPSAGPVPHTHTKEDETIFVIEGELRAWLGGKQYDVKTGDSRCGLLICIFPIDLNRSIQQPDNNDDGSFRWAFAFLCNSGSKGVIVFSDQSVSKR